MIQVDEEIAKVRELYRQLTGTDPKTLESPYAPIPPEANAETFVQENLRRMYGALNVGQPDTAPNVDLSWPTMVPAICVSESDTAWRCQIDLPGVDKKNVAVHVVQGMLRIAATRAAQSPTGHRAVHVESGPCRLERRIPLPPFVKNDTAEAKLEHGCLTVQLQKDASATGREVAVVVA